MTPAGFPHSDILGSTSARDSPGLNAACHVLHRLLAPRHPPRALCSLTSTQHLTRRSVSGCGRSGSPIITANTDHHRSSDRIDRSTAVIYPVVKVHRRGGSRPTCRPSSDPAGRWARDDGAHGSEDRVARAALARARCLLECKVAIPADGSGGGDEETRTPDPLLAKEMLCQLSYVPVVSAGREWWAHLDSNQGPRPYQGRALTS